MKTINGSAMLRWLGFITVLTFLGCGGEGGGGLVVPASYTGTTDQAALTMTNVSSLINTTWEDSRASLDITEAMPAMDTPGTVSGNCGGTATIVITVDNTTGTFNGSLAFVGYCTLGTTLNGTVPFKGHIDLLSRELTQLTLTFNNLRFSAANRSFTFMEGNISYLVKPDLSGETDTINLVMRNNSDQKTYWLNNYTTVITYGLEDSVTTTGRFYDHDNGYIELTTLTPLNITNFGPDSGVLLFSGKGSRARLTFHADLSTLLELDANNDGNFITIPDPAAFTLIRQFLQFRTYENPANNRFAALVDYKINGQVLQPGDLLTARIYDPADLQLIPTAAPTFLNNRYTVAVWNPALIQFGNIGTDGDSGFSFNLSHYAALAAGRYRIEVDAANGDLLTSLLDYPGKLELPVVAATGMSYHWGLDGSLTLVWSPPAGTFDQYRVVLSDQNNLGIFYGRVLPGVNQVTLQASLIAQINQLSAPTQVTWTVQTRDYIGNDNYARGISNPISLPWP